MSDQKLSKLFKQSINPKARRYSPSERKKILELTKVMSIHELKVNYGIAYDTIYRWQRLEKIKLKDKEDLQTTNQYSGEHPNWKRVVAMWKAYPGLGPAQIKNQLYREGIQIAINTVRRILEENGYTPPKSEIKEKRVKRYEAVRPRELIHIDFKHFYINKQKVYLLLMQDDYSRFLCGYRLTCSENITDVTEVFEACVNLYGKMQTIMTDAGSAFYSWNGINRFQKLVAEEYGIDQIKAKSPRSNGKIESVNKQIEKELLNIDRFASIEEANTAIEDWISFYNFERTHMGLPQGEVPADRFLFGWNRTDKKLLTTKEAVLRPSSTSLLSKVIDTFLGKVS